MGVSFFEAKKALLPGSNLKDETHMLHPASGRALPTRHGGESSVQQLARVGLPELRHQPGHLRIDPNSIRGPETEIELFLFFHFAWRDD